MRAPLLLLVLGVPALAGDPYCPRYPESVRTATEEALTLDREFQALARVDRRTKAAGRLAESSNFIDRLIAKKMNAAGVTPADPSTDPEFLRRVSLDLTGRIPAVDKAAAFLDDQSAGKRETLIDELLDSSAFADQLTWYFINRFKVTRSHESISTTARNTFYNFVRNAMATDRPYNDFVRELISAAGEVDTSPGTQFFARWMDVAWIKDNYAKPLRVEELAEIAGMGVSTLHHHFRALTAMSPLQYQKQIRLQEARARMSIHGLDVGSAGLEVGYESASQFTRE